MAARRTSDAKVWVRVLEQRVLSIDDASYWPGAILQLDPLDAKALAEMRIVELEKIRRHKGE